MVKHAYQPGCNCETCTTIRVVTDRATVYRMASEELGHPDWSGRATARLVPGQ